MKLSQDDATEEDTIAAETEEADDLATAVRTALIRLDSLLDKNKLPYLSYCPSVWFSALSTTQVKQ